MLTGPFFGFFCNELYSLANVSAVSGARVVFSDRFSLKDTFCCRCISRSAAELALCSQLVSLAVLSQICFCFNLGTFLGKIILT